MDTVVLPAAHHRQYVSRLVPGDAAVLSAIIILTSVIDSTTIGYDGSLIGSLNVMAPYQAYLASTTALVSLNSCVIFVGGAASAPFVGILINYLGRRYGMLIAAVFEIVGAILQGCATNLGMFIAGRFLIGFGSGIAAVTAPTYVAETSPPKWRAFALGMYYTSWAIGTLLAAGVCYGTQSIPNNWSWRIPSLLQIVPAIFCIVILAFIPESPRWLVYKGETSHALEVLAIVNGGKIADPSVQLQYQEILDTIEYEKSEGATLGIRELFKSAPNRKRLFLALSVAPLVQITGSNIITFYFGSLLDSAGITDSHTQLEINVILSVWQLVVATAGSLLAERIGRKWLAGLSCTFCGLTAKYGQSSNQSGIYGTVACVFLFLGAYSFGLTPITVIYPPEVLTYSMRGTGMGLFTFLGKSCGVFVSWVFPYMLNAIGWKTYIVNASWNVLFIFIIVFFWVETKGLTLEEIDERFDGVKHSEVCNLNQLGTSKEDVEREIEVATISK
ncbi:putative hexose transporter protein [Coleophoma cylindrospora]|uniref:Putative hexose transporter protein n=1 Tax=Coleophoma cylindrospora TaxID=1849047 RepID=A0A3D8QKW2_9HELO|nr:putative hexose transporter protein [Coleophoma cylindrospora]